MDHRKNMNEIRMRRKARVRKSLTRNADSPRLSVFRSNRAFYAQLIDDTLGHTIAAVNAADLKGKPASKAKGEVAFTLGTLMAEKAVAAGVKRAVFDRGSYPYHGRVKAFVEGVRKGGLII